MRIRAHLLMTSGVLASAAYGVGRLAAQTQAPPTPELYRVAAPSVQYQNSGYAGLLQAGTAAPNGNATLQWPLAMVNPVNPQQIAADQQQIKALEEDVRSAEHRLEAERSKMQEIERKRKGVLTEAMRTSLLTNLNDHQSRLASRQMELVQQRNQLAMARAMLQQRGQPQQFRIVPSAPVAPSQPAATRSYGRSLLFTPQDAAQVKLFHPLLTPDVRTEMIPLMPSPQHPQAAPHK